MSTKIYNGIKFNVKDIHDLTEKTFAWRERISVLTEEAKIKFLANIIYSALDGHQLGFLKSNQWKEGSVLRYAIDTYETRLKKTKEQYSSRDPAVDMDFSFTVHPHGDEFYGIVFCERNEWNKEFMDLEWVEPFPYWDNTDPPEGISEEDWDERGCLWDSLIPSGIPARHGFTADCEDTLSQSSYYLSGEQSLREAILANIPPKETRYKKYIDSGLFVIWDKLNPLAPLAEGETWPWSVHVERASRFEAWKKADGDQHIASVEENIKSKILDITMKHLDIEKDKF